MHSQSSSLASPPVAANQARYDVLYSDVDEVYHYGHAELQATQVQGQSIAALVAGLLGCAALITEAVCATNVNNGCYGDWDCDQAYMGPGVGSGIFLILQGFWAFVLLRSARQVRRSIRPGTGPLPRNVLCHATTFTVVNVFGAIGCVLTATTELIISSEFAFGIAVAAMLYVAAATTFIASFFGCCATFQAGCGCYCCEYTYANVHHPALPQYQPLASQSFGGTAPAPVAAYGTFQRSQRTSSGSYDRAQAWVAPALPASVRHHEPVPVAHPVSASVATAPPLPESTA